ncbi:MAG: hypothetical protein KatS3mg115_0999 [Candidatus Poribacteria bacterium]|nr:MAG: hypothetical protein KatS3mg115_0999 [Candidatus Poribacteria bacterium]
MREILRRALWVFWRTFQVGFIFGVIVLLVGTAYFAYYVYKKSQEVPGLEALDYGEIKTWRQHSEVYGDAIPVMRNTAYDHLRRRLERLEYRVASAERLEPGTYLDQVGAGGNGVLFLYPRRFPHPRIQQEPRLFSIRFQNGLVESIETEGGRRVEVAYLEPELIDELYPIDEQLARQLVRLDEVPQDLIHAFLAIEDHDFYKHSGVHPRRFFVAAVRNVLYGRLYGASTITQQLARNILLTPDKQIERKVKEWILAIRIERRYSKDEILERYLNFIDFGRRYNRTLFGVKEAARYFFDKDVRDLTLVECATLAAIPNAPTRYSPVLHPENARRRRNLVLRQMLRLGYISQEQYARAVAQPLQVAELSRQVVRGSAPYASAYVRSLLEARYSQEELYGSGLRVYTTLDPLFQEEAVRAVREHLRRLDAELGYQPYEEVREQVRAKLVPPEVLREYIQAGLVSLEAQTGFVRALVGGRDFEYNQYNHVTQARRQPGSVFKPIVYTAAWRQGFRPSDTIIDEPWSLWVNNKGWTPTNYHEGRYYGLVSLEEALQRSLNVATARLVNDPEIPHVGVQAVVRTARDLGITSPLPPLPSLALGAAEVTLLEITAAYTAFANLGVRAEPIIIRYVTRFDGTVLEERAPLREQAIEPEVAYTTTRVLQGVLDKPFGTGYRVRSEFGYRHPAAGKTGTTSEFTDAWFIGFTPRLVTGIWVGFDDPQKKVQKPGAEGALPIWANYMIAITRGPEENFPVPRALQSAEQAYLP